MPPKPLWRRILGHVAAQWNLIVMGVLIALAYAFPRVGMTGGAVRAEYTVTWGGVALIFFIAGLSLSLDALKNGLPHIQAHAVCSVFTYLVAPALALGFGTAGRDAGLDVYVMGGMVVTGGLPTTVASNVSATLASGGSTALASIEVLISNTLGPFIAPLLAKMFLTSRMGWEAAQPGNGELTPIYIRMAKQLSAALLGPMLVGLFIQHLFPRPVARIRAALHLAKVAAFLTSLCVWHSFSNAFASGAFLTASHASIIYLCFMSWASYLILTALVFLVVRLPGVPGRVAAWWRMSKRDSLALLFCGPAKGVAVGAPTIAILYADRELAVQAKISLALVIYQGEQVAMAQVVVPLLRWWARDEVDAHEAAEDERLRMREIAKSRGVNEEKSESEDVEKSVATVEKSVATVEKSVATVEKSVATVEKSVATVEKSVATVDLDLGVGIARHQRRASIQR
ncbi:hypothetical protein CspeluHIS016_0301650 [Cutaneotrichosporon spelunceum]|uniref:Sodium bile acid symporter family protein n=1 Tax=Cutaneotrichosporon spelunceum TaxID=1672016 RepID=A0AAD3TSZ3_9TREE|nr:hypothetical protein CspeluHIS016_0301650 [Cutaneotrichosporon spelunceum]